jgi:hypothetical protein
MGMENEFARHFIILKGHGASLSRARFSTLHGHGCLLFFIMLSRNLHE